MEHKPTLTTLTDPDCAECTRCGALVAVTGSDRHEAWHEFVESAITGLAADLAALDPA